MKLYFTPGTCALADHITLEWIGQPYETQLVTKEERKQPAYLAINPAGAVPALDVDGWILTQNVAILNYLADLDPDSKLGGDGSPESRAKINQWLSLVNSDILPLFKPFFGGVDYLDEAGVAKVRDTNRGMLRALFERVDQQLDGKHYVVGERSIVDPYLFVTLRWARGFKLDLSGLDNVHAFFARMHRDAGVRQALEAQGTPP